MTTLAANKPRAFEGGGHFNDFTLATSTHIFAGGAVGLVVGTGLARPLVGGDKFVGFADARVDDSVDQSVYYYGTTVHVRDDDEVQLPITGAVITDVGLPVYATDDDTFSYSPVAGSFIGLVKRFVSAGNVVVEFNPNKLRDPYEGWTHQLVDTNTTIDATYTGKWLWNDTDGVVYTLPAVEGINFVRFGNLGAFGTVQTSVAPNAVDMIEGPGIAAADNKAIINTKATAQRGDWLEIANGDVNGWSSRFKGVWARAA
jgi:hypothetical protein